MENKTKKDYNKIRVKELKIIGKKLGINKFYKKRKQQMIDTLKLIEFNKMKEQIDLIDINNYLNLGSDVANIISQYIPNMCMFYDLAPKPFNGKGSCCNNMNNMNNMNNVNNVNNKSLLQKNNCIIL